MKKVLFGCMALALVGCGPLVVQTATPKHFADKGGLKRAAFEFDCPEEELKVQNLGQDKVGVSGCGKKAVYLYVQTGSHSAEYVNNTGTAEK